MFARRRFWFFGLLITASAAGAVAYWHHHRYKHWAVHETGMVYRSAWVEPDVFSEQIEKFQIRAVLNLCNPNEMGAERSIRQRQAVEGAGAKLIELPMPADTIDAGDPAIAPFVDVLADPQNYPLLVHCQHGVTRTAKVLAMYDILFRDKGAAQSLGDMPLFGRPEYNVSVQAFAKNFEKRRHELFPLAEHQLDVLRR